MAVAGEEHYEYRIVEVVHRGDDSVVLAIGKVPLPKNKLVLWDEDFLNLQGMSHWELCSTLPVVSRGYTRGFTAHFKRVVPSYDAPETDDRGGF